MFTAVGNDRYKLPVRVSVFLSFSPFFSSCFFFSPISKLDDLGPWLDVCTSAGRSRDPDASEQKTLVETQEWEREQVPGTKTWKSETPGVERGAGTSDPGTLSTNSLREWFKPGLKIRTGAEGGAQEEKKTEPRRRLDRSFDFVRTFWKMVDY